MSVSLVKLQIELCYAQRMGENDVYDNLSKLLYEINNGKVIDVNDNLPEGYVSSGNACNLPKPIKGHRTYGKNRRDS